MDLIDLHTHSTASDGTDAPSAIVEKAAALGLRAVTSAPTPCALSWTG